MSIEFIAFILICLQIFDPYIVAVTVTMYMLKQQHILGR
jgi:hypothetical protein